MIRKTTTARDEMIRKTTFISLKDFCGHMRDMKGLYGTIVFGQICHEIGPQEDSIVGGRCD